MKLHRGTTFYNLITSLFSVIPCLLVDRSTFVIHFHEGKTTRRLIRKCILSMWGKNVIFTILVKIMYIQYICNYLLYTFSIHALIAVTNHINNHLLMLGELTFSSCIKPELIVTCWKYMTINKFYVQAFSMYDRNGGKRLFWFGFLWLYCP